MSDIDGLKKLLDDGFRVVLRREETGYAGWCGSALHMNLRDSFGSAASAYGSTPVSVTSLLAKQVYAAVAIWKAGTAWMKCPFCNRSLDVCKVKDLKGIPLVNVKKNPWRVCCRNEKCFAGALGQQVFGPSKHATLSRWFVQMNGKYSKAHPEFRPEAMK